jgi:uncharacterized protein YkwD
MSAIHRASDPALLEPGRMRLVRLSAAIALGLVLFGGAAYSGNRIFTGSDTAGGRAAADAPPPAAAPAGTGSAVAESPVAAEPAPPPPPATSSVAPAPVPTKAKPAVPPTQEAARPPAAPAGVTGEVLRLVNAERARAGCRALTADSRLARAANAHSADMAANNYFSHTGRNGSDVSDRVEAAGYNWRSVGENIAKGQPTPAAVMRDWMNSSGHRANILNCGFRNIGIGVAYAGRSPVWTQDFGTP